MTHRIMLGTLARTRRSGHVLTIFSPKSTKITNCNLTLWIRYDANPCTKHHMYVPLVTLVTPISSIKWKSLSKLIAHYPNINKLSYHIHMYVSLYSFFTKSFQSNIMNSHGFGESVNVCEVKMLAHNFVTFLTCLCIVMLMLL